jgi:hypothetical protein
MTGRIIYQPDWPTSPHRCSPPVVESAYYVHPQLPSGTVWQCACKRTWVLRSDRGGTRFTPERKREKKRREARCTPEPLTTDVPTRPKADSHSPVESAATPVSPQVQAMPVGSGRRGPEARARHGKSLWPSDVGYSNWLPAEGEP